MQRVELEVKANESVKDYLIKNNITPNEEQKRKLNQGIKNFLHRANVEGYEMPLDINLNSLKIDIADIFEDKANGRKEL